MAVITNTALTYTQVGIREDLSDVIYNLKPVDTPLFSSLTKTKGKAITFDWQTETMTTGTTGTAKIEGDEASYDGPILTTRLSNVMQINDQTAIISDSVEETDRAGRAGEMAHQLMLKGKILKTNVEADLFSNTAKSTGSSATPRRTASILSWLKTNPVYNTVDGANPAAADGTGTRTDGTQRILTQDMFLQAQQNCWDNGGNPNKAYVRSYNKKLVSGFSGYSTKTMDGSAKKITLVVSVFESDFGTLDVVLNRFSRARDIPMLDTDMWEFRELRPMRQRELAKTGDAEKRQIIMEWGLVCKNEISSGGVFDLTSA